MSIRVATTRAGAGAVLGMALAALMALPSPGHAQGMDQNGSAMNSPVMGSIRMTAQRYQRNLVGSAQEMPANKYSYKPTEQQMSFGQLVLHVAGSNEFMCSSISGQARPQHSTKLEATSPKDQLVARLKESFDYCSSALGKMDDSGLDAQVPFFGNRKVPRAAAVMALGEDWADHYAQAAIYLRLNGLLPPSAQRRGGM